MSDKDKKTAQILSENLFPVVGIGASAGGLEAFKELVKAIPSNSGMAYILVQHLAPQYESALTDILKKSANIPVLEVTDNIKVMPDHIYVIPSNHLLIANDGVLLLDDLAKEDKSNTIDVFLTSLAEVHQEHTIGIILSGTGSDGTLGLKTIKDLGGITVVQDERTAAYYGMPQSAINAEVVDFILSPREIPGHLLELMHTSQIINSDFTASEEIKEEEVFKQILSILRTRKGVDFTYYKQTTIRRRIIRRKGLNKIEKIKEYYSYLLENKGEQDALFKDILIPVTAFFRDQLTFTFLCETIFPDIFKNKLTTDPIRIWIAGCSTGEEAYSMAMCLYEYFSDQVPVKKIQVFATDISETSVAKARSGIYPKKDLAGVSESRINQFFKKIDGSYQVKKHIREACVFASQNFLKDPPFAKIDLISCRNVLIYMEPYLQKRALNTFHYALNPMGFLLLGRSETVGHLSERFNLISQPNKIYSRKDIDGKFMQVVSERSEANYKVKDVISKHRERKVDFEKAADDVLLSKYTPVGVIVNEQLNILQFRGSTGAYLEAAPGKASHNILKMAKQGLYFELRNAIDKAKLDNEVVKKTGIVLKKDKRRIDIEVIPLKYTIESYFLILFHDTIDQDLLTHKKNDDISNETNFISEAGHIEQLEKELAEMREDMRTVTEEQEAANEELHSANEELLSSSEELQALNEELETTKEEIQSSNEELSVLNQELIERNEQLNNSRKYVEAIIATIHEPIIILTKDFRVKTANKAFYELLNETKLQTEGKIFFELGGGLWNIPGLREKLGKILPESWYFEGFEAGLFLPLTGERILALNARQIINEINNEQLILLAIQDITDRKLIEKNKELFAHELELQVIDRTKELKEANINLQHTNEDLQQFASIASHDLQEPLRKIKTFTTVLEKNFCSNLSDEGKEVISKIMLSADRMSRLIKDVLAYSKVAHIAKEFIQTDLHTIFKNVVNDMDLLVSETGATIIYKDPLPVIEAIPLQINQLFYNLLSNSLKFYKDTAPPVVTISFKILTAAETKGIINIKEDDFFVEINFSDNGIGFEMQFEEQIFKIFERLHSSDEFEGTGVGLAICKKIIENHNGHIFASSSEEGASFYITLPIEQ